MNVQMPDDLSARDAIVDYYSVSPFVYSQNGGDFLYSEKEIGHDGTVVFIQVFNARNMIFMYDENMNRGFGINVLESDDSVIFIDYSCGMFPFDYIAEQAAHGMFRSCFFNRRLSYYD